MRWLILIVLGWVSSSVIASDDVLDTHVRPKLPPHVRTVADAATYYAETVGYRFYAHTPGSGDARKLVYSPVRRIDNDSVVTLREALLSIVPEHVSLMVDHRANALAYRVQP